MHNDILKLYINDHFMRLLGNYNIEEDIKLRVANDIENRLASVISRWNDTNFRRTLLVIGNEEALFYKPHSNLEVRSLVVVTIRNSLLEDLSTDRSTLGIKGQVIPDSDIMLFTGNAITFFSKLNLSDISKGVTVGETDPFGMLPVMYPATWEAFQHLSDWTKLEDFYEPIKLLPMQIDETEFKDVDTSIKFRKQVKSGIEPIIDNELLDVLNRVKRKELALLAVDSLKMLTRNPNKLFWVIEFLLSINSAMITSNYYISNGYVAKREKFTLPAHNSKEAEENLKNMKGLVKRHREVIKTLR